MFTILQRRAAVLFLPLAITLLAACGNTGTPSGVANPTSAATQPTAALATAQPTEVPPTTAAPTEQPGRSDAQLPEVDPASVTGDIIIAGSSTVFPLSERMAERFKDEGYTGNITIDSVGTGAGFERFCKSAETDIANASRAIKDTEIEACKANNRTPIEFRVGTDALAVVVSNENTFVNALALEELVKIFSGEAKTWADINASWPKEPIKIFSPGTDSGTFDFFVEVVLEGEKEKLLGANPQLSEDDNVLVQGVEGSSYAIGYFGYAYFDENKGKLKALKINDIEPNEKTTEDNSYPLSRPLFIYSDAAIMKEKPQVAAFINFYLTYVNEEIASIGYFPASKEALAKSVKSWMEVR